MSCNHREEELGLEKTTCEQVSLVIAGFGLEEDSLRQSRDTDGIESHLKRVQIRITEQISELFDTVPGAGSIVNWNSVRVDAQTDLRMMGFGTAECHLSFDSLPATLCNIFSRAKFIFCNDCNFCI